MRRSRILENYCRISGGGDKQKILPKFEGIEKTAAASLLSWVNDGSHFVEDELFVRTGDQAVEFFLRVFERVFNAMGHEAHYQMMTTKYPLRPVLDDEVPLPPV